MFGYVSVFKPELKFSEYYEFKGFYCGLCRVLGEQYGLTGKLTLSNDMTFLIVLLTSLYECEIKEERHFCIAHPMGVSGMRKQLMLTNEITDYAAAMNIVLTMHHFIDDWEDERKMTARVGMAAFKSRYEAIREKFSEKVAAVEEKLGRLSALISSYESDPQDKERDRVLSEIDETSGAFGELMSELFVYKKDAWEERLRGIGFYLGKFIYLMDAYDDLKQDVQKGNYNPLKGIMNDEDFEEQCNMMLTASMAECTSYFEQLPCIKDAGILHNILYDGVWGRYQKIRTEEDHER